MDLLKKDTTSEKEQIGFERKRLFELKAEMGLKVFRFHFQDGQGWKVISSPSLSVERLPPPP